MNIKDQIESAQFMIDDYESHESQTQFIIQRLAYWKNLLAELKIQDRDQKNRDEIIEELNFHETPDTEMTESEKKYVVEIVMAHLKEYENMLRDIILEKFRPENGHILIIGVPGAGKSTQGRHLAEILGIEYISTGDLLRDEVKKQTELGKQASAYMTRGELVPDDLVIQMVESRLGEMSMCILDGFPRSEAQVNAYPNFSQAAILLNLSDDVAVKRLMEREEGRADDRDPATARNRMDVFHAQTQPVVDHYETMNALTTVTLEDNDRIWQVWAKMIEAMVADK